MLNLDLLWDWGRRILQDLRLGLGFRFQHNKRGNGAIPA